MTPADLARVNPRATMKRLCIQCKKVRVRKNKNILCSRVCQAVYSIAHRTRCVRGHAFNEENTRHRPGNGRSCKKCENIKSKKYWNGLSKSEKRAAFLKRKNGSPEKYKSRYTFRNALTRGELKKMPCVICGKRGSEGHHPDYSKPLEVVWLCRPHHSEEHQVGLLRELGVGI